MPNTVKMLNRCKSEFVTRSLMIDLFQLLLKYETRQQMLKSAVQSQPTYIVTAQAFNLIRTEAH